MILPERSDLEEPVFEGTSVRRRHIYCLERMGSSSLTIILCLAGAAVVLLVIILLVIYKLKYDRLKVSQQLWMKSPQGIDFFEPGSHRLLISAPWF
jgi:hypothetical protein